MSIDVVMMFEELFRLCIGEERAAYPWLGSIGKSDQGRPHERTPRQSAPALAVRHLSELFDQFLLDFR